MIERVFGEETGDVERIVPRRPSWKAFHDVLKDLGFYDVIRHDDGRVTANLYVTDLYPWEISLGRSIVVHVTFTRKKRHVTSTVMIKVPDGKRTSGMDFASPREAIVAALKAERLLYQEVFGTPDDE